MKKTAVIHKGITRIFHQNKIGIEKPTVFESKELEDGLKTPWKRIFVDEHETNIIRIV